MEGRTRGGGPMAQSAKVLYPLPEIIAIHPVHTAKPITSLKNRCKLAGWNLGYLETLIRQSA
jgi:hypothetical protein